MLTRTRSLAALFIVYLVLLTWVILWKLEVPYIGAAAGLAHPIKLIPFVPSGDAGASSPLEVVANILLFVPFGVYLKLLAPRWRVWQSAAVFFGASLLLEIAQPLLSIGNFDSTDVIANTVGGLAGLGLLALLGRSISVKVLAIGTAVALVAVTAYLVSPLRYTSPRDVVVDRSSSPHV